MTAAVAEGRKHSGTLSLSFFSDDGQPTTLAEWRRARQAKRGMQQITPPEVYKGLHVKTGAPTRMDHCNSDDVCGMTVALLTSGRSHASHAEVSWRPSQVLDVPVLLEHMAAGSS